MITVNKYERIKTYSLDEVLPFVYYGEPKKHGKQYKKPNNALSQKDYDGHMVYMNSDRYQCFDFHGTHCVKCGLVGEFFALERFAIVNGKSNTQDRYHFNLYGIKGGREVMISKDHVIPVSKGGKDRLNNYQTMCVECNKAKGSVDNERFMEFFIGNFVALKNPPQTMIILNTNFWIVVDVDNKPNYSIQNLTTGEIDKVNFNEIRKMNTHQFVKDWCQNDPRSADE